MALDRSFGIRALLLIRKPGNAVPMQLNALQAALAVHHQSESGHIFSMCYSEAALREFSHRDCIYW